MKLRLIGTKKLSKPPTAISFSSQRVYVSLKGYHSFYTDDMSSLKSIRFSSQVNSLSSFHGSLFCCQKNGTVFALAENHKTLCRANVGDAGCSHSLINNSELYISTGRKIVVFNTADLSLKNTYFVGDSPIASFDVSDDSVAAAMVNTQNIQVINKASKAAEALKTADGFPEIVKFIKNGVLAVGSTAGVLSCYSTVNMKRISYLKLPSTPTAIQVISSTLLVVGIKSEIHLIDLSQFNKMESVSKIDVGGIPVGFWGSGPVYCAVSRESRLGRWDKCADAQNQLVKISLDGD